MGSFNFHFNTFFFITPLSNENRIVPNQITYQNFISDLGSLPETSMKVEKKSELIGRGGVYRRPVGWPCKVQMLYVSSLC
jgi:hypothetical protein